MQCDFTHIYNTFHAYWSYKIKYNSSHNTYMYKQFIIDEYDIYIYMLCHLG